MGLLQKATEHTEHTPSIRENRFPEIKEKLVKIKNRIEFYPVLFKELAELLAIEKGSLLIRDGEMFTLSAIVGYDETTKNRLRMSVNEYEEYVEKDDNRVIQKYFSIREFVTINQIHIVPFTNNGRVEGLLLVTEYKTQRTPKASEIREYTKELETLFGENPLQKLKNIETQSSDIKESITVYLQKIKNSENRVIILKLSLDNLIKALIDGNDFSTRSSIKNSAVKILSSFAKNRGRVFQLYNNDILITLLDKNGSTNVTVVQQQINSAFKSIFSNKLSGVDHNFESLIWKNNSLDTILDHFIQDAVN